MDASLLSPPPIAPIAARTWRFVRHETGWALAGAPAFMVPDSPTIMAHDVVHHREDDRGSFFDELASVGAESYFDEAGARLNIDDVATTLHSVMSMYWESLGIDALRLSTPRAHAYAHLSAADSRASGVDASNPVALNLQAPLALNAQHPVALDAQASTHQSSADPSRSPTISSIAIPDAVGSLWALAWERAVEETVDFWGLAHDPDAAFVSTPAYAAAVLAALQVGWRAAAGRWPDPAEGNALFRTIESALTPPVAVGTQVLVSRNAQGQLHVETIEMPPASSTSIETAKPPRRSAHRPR